MYELLYMYEWLYMYELLYMYEWQSKSYMYPPHFLHFCIFFIYCLALLLGDDVPLVLSCCVYISQFVCARICNVSDFNVIL
jgi:hypothetical protein